eukprot:COSAG03_NODE_972_length_5142_cov_3.351576_5_plen_194_part_00
MLSRYTTLGDLTRLALDNYECTQLVAGLCGVFVGNLIFNQVRETIDHGTLNAWERGPYFSDIGYLEDPSGNLKPSATELQAGATPGFKRQPGSGPASNGSAVGQYRRLESNFLIGNYNVNSNLETDDGSSRYLLYNNYFVFSTAATDFAINANWNYYVSISATSTLTARQYCEGGGRAALQRTATSTTRLSTC